MAKGSTCRSLGTCVLATGGCNGVAFPFEQGVDLLSIVIGWEDVIFYLFSAVISFGVSEVTRLVFLMPFV